MSDIGLGDGILFALGALITIGLGGASLFLALALGLILPYAVGTSPAARVFRFARGPLFCLVVGGVCLALANVATPIFDDLWFACPAVGAILGAVVAFSSERSYRAKNPQRDQPPNRKLVIAVLVIVSSLVAALIVWQARYWCRAPK